MTCSAPVIISLCGAPVGAGALSGKEPPIRSESELKRTPQPANSFARKAGDAWANRAEVDERFAEWLQKRLAAERTAVVEHLQEYVARQLCDHHKTLSRSLEEAVRQPAEGKAVGSHPLQAMDLHEGSSWRRKVSTGESVPSRRSAERVLEEKVQESCEHCENETPKNESSKGMGSQLCMSPKSNTSSINRAQLFQCTLTEDRLGAQSLKPPKQGWVHDFVRSWIFELLVAVSILANTVMMALEVQFVGVELGHTLGHPRYSSVPSDMLPTAQNVFGVVSVVYACIFIAEFLLRCLDLQCGALKSPWMWFDAAVLSISVLDVLGRYRAELMMDVNVSAMRLGRLCKMLRVMELLRSRDCFASLFLLMKSIQASVYALLWSCVMLLLVMLIAGLLINQLLLGYLNDQEVPVEERLEVFNLFGTYTRMFITMFEFTLGNWAPPQRVLMRNVAEWWGLFVVTYRSVLCFALVNISAAVFNSETSKAAQADSEVAMLNRERTTRRYMGKLDSLFQELDTTADGRLSWEEFEELSHNKVLKRFLAILGVEFEDTKDLFRLLDDGDGMVVREEFVRGMTLMKGEAKSLDLVVLTKLARNMDQKLDAIIAK